MINVNALNLSFGTAKVLNNVNLQVQKGQSVGADSNLTRRAD